MDLPVVRTEAAAPVVLGVDAHAGVCIMVALDGPGRCLGRMI